MIPSAFATYVFDLNRLKCISFHTFINYNYFSVPDSMTLYSQINCDGNIFVLIFILFYFFLTISWSSRASLQPNFEPKPIIWEFKSSLGQLIFVYFRFSTEFWLGNEQITIISDALSETLKWSRISICVMWHNSY